jgi:hypothetical protein
MSGFLTDGEGNKSSKRLLQILSTISGIVLGFIVSLYSISQGQADIGSNMMLLIGTLVGAGIGGGVGILDLI